MGEEINTSHWEIHGFFFAYRRLLPFVTHLSSHSLNFHFHISMFFYEGTLVWMAVAPHWVQLMPKIWCMMYVSIISCPHVLGVISSRLIHLIFNYRPGLVGLELTQNICKGRGGPMVSWQYFKKQKIERYFKMKNWVKLLRIQLLR